MMFLTVGTQLPFDRLVAAVDAWAGDRGRQDIFGQIADPGPSGYKPKNFEWTAHVAPPDFQARFEAAPCVIGHAGMGTIITALSMGKPLMIMPRRAHLGEQRNDHQMATAGRFGDKPGIQVAVEPEDVADCLDALVTAAEGAGDPISPFAQPALIAALRTEIGVS